MTVYITEWTKTCLAARDGAGGGEMGLLHGIMIITVAHCTNKDRTGTPPCHLVFMRMHCVCKSLLCLSVSSGLDGGVEG